MMSLLPDMINPIRKSRLKTESVSYSKVRLQKIYINGVSIGDKCVLVNGKNVKTCKISKIHGIIEKDPCFATYSVTVESRGENIKCQCVYSGFTGRVCLTIE